ncbi:MAG TPA: diacylglycerol kinase family protein [Ktedonobacterales bacterium]|nr:diacylglycerol kinase family protein [Ktedonobacterales bacterium]
MSDRFVRACLITNPKSGRGGVDLSEALTVLQANGWDVTVRQKLKGGMAEKLAREAVEQGYNVVVDCGGDGTLSEIINGVVGADIAVGTLPGGTANVWAHEMGISQELRRAAMQLVTATRRRVDVGHVDVNGKHGAYFLMMAGIGLDAAVMSRVNKKLKNRIGKLAIGLAALESLPDARVVPVQIDLDGSHWQGKVSQIVVGNTRRYGGFASMTPDAYANDGQLDACLVTAATPFAGIKQLASLAVRGRPNPRSSEVYRAASIVVRSPIVLSLETDGGVIDLDDDDLTPDGVIYTFRPVAQGISVLVPRTYLGDLFEPATLGTRAPLAPLKPVRNQQALDKGVGGRTGADLRKRAKWFKQRYQIITVGGDTITAAREKDGKVVKVVVTPDTTLKELGDGKEKPLWGGLTALSAEDIVRVKGVKDGTKGTIVAYRVKREPSASLRALHVG